jgi:hypothetical protein
MLENPLTLDPQVRDMVTKVTCPFLSSVVHQELLSVRGATSNPLASIEDVRARGNTGGGDLGDLLSHPIRARKGCSGQSCRRSSSPRSSSSDGSPSGS